MSDEYDSHQRIGARCTRIRSFTSRPSEATDTRPGNKSSAYCKSRGEDKCDFCGSMCFVDSMEDKICKACVIDIRRGT